MKDRYRYNWKERKWIKKGNFECAYEYVCKISDPVNIARRFGGGFVDNGDGTMTLRRRPTW